MAKKGNMMHKINIINTNLTFLLVENLKHHITNSFQYEQICPETHQVLLKVYLV